MKKEAEKTMRGVSAVVSFDEGAITIGEERTTEWKAGWKKFKKILNEGQKRNKQRSFEENELQSEV